MTPTKNAFDLSGLFDFLEDVLAWVNDRDGRYLWVNRAFLVNYALEHPELDAAACSAQVLGKTDYDLSPPFLADQFRLDDEHVFSWNRLALSCGFADQSHFTREFHRQSGRTPRDYREHYKTVTAVPGTKSAVSRQ